MKIITQHKDFAAMFLIMLVLTLPFYSADVLADGAVGTIKAKGKDNIEGIVRTTDAVTIEALISGLTTTAQPIHVRLGSSQNFDSCSLNLNGSLCKVRFPATGEQTFDAKELPFTVTLLDSDSFNTLDSKSGSVIVDNRKPTLSFGSVFPQNAGREDLTFVYGALDTACLDTSCSGKCSGIKKIEFFPLDNSFSDTVEVNTRSCSFNSTFVKNSAAFQPGQLALFARATDMIGQVSNPVSINFAADTTGPSFIPESFKISYKGNDLSHFVPGKAIPVEVVIRANDSSFDYSSVTANLFELNPTDNSLKNVRGTCSPLDNTARCVFAITLKIDTAGTKQLSFNASDTKGNGENIAITRTFAVDTTGPTVSALTSSGQVLADTSYAPALANLRAIVTEIGAGISFGEMFLTLRGQQISATNCNVTYCLWENVALGQGNVEVTFSDASTDILGNKAISFSKTFTVNSDPPIIRKATLGGIGGLSGLATEFIGVGDRILIEMNVSEDTSITSALADVSQFIAGASAVPGSCINEEGNTFLCSILTTPVEKAAIGKVKLTVTDAAGNNASIEKSLQTYAVLSNLTPNFWTSAVLCSPQTLDRQLGPLVGQRSYCAVTLAPRAIRGSLKTASITLAGCTGDAVASSNGTTANLIQSAELFGARAGSISPLIKLTLKKDALKVNEIRTTCTLNIISLADGAITRNPEEEKVQITLNFFDQPLGTLGLGVQAKIDEAMEATKGVDKLIGTLNEVLNVLKNICKIFNVLYSIVGFLYSAAISLKIASATCQTFLVTTLGIPCAPLMASAEATCTGKETTDKRTSEGFAHYGSQACKLVNCQWRPELVNTIFLGVPEKWIISSIVFPYRILFLKWTRMGSRQLLLPKKATLTNQKADLRDR